MSDEDHNPFDGDGVTETEQSCWKDSSRLCGDECVAFDEKSFEDPRWAPCLLLNIQRAQAKSHANIAAELKRQNDMQEAVIDQAVEASDEALSSAKKRAEAEAYAKKVKEMDPGPPEIK
jgi:hypothetical protein